MNLRSEPQSQRAIEVRAGELFQGYRYDLHARTDRLFAWLLLGQWAAAIAAAYWISPRAWAGSQSETHPHVWTAIVLGGLIVWLPVVLALRWPGRTATRHAIAIAQSLIG